MVKKCPNCSSDRIAYIGKYMTYPTPVVFLALGGLLFPMVYGSSRRGIYQCSDCKKIFKRHSIGSILMQPLLWAFFLIFTCIFVSVIFVIGMLIRDAI